MAYEVTIKHKADLDLSKIKTYLSQFYDSTPKKFFDNFYKSLERLSFSPFHRKWMLNPAYRVYNIDRYMVFYKINEKTKEIFICRVINSMRNLKYRIEDMDVRENPVPYGTETIKIMKKDKKYLADKKQNGAPITMVTAYDYPTAKILDDADIDSVLVGDSVGTNVLGYKSEREVTIDDMIRHTSAVCRAVKNAFVIADMPYGCADNVNDAVKYAKMLIECGTDCVKIEGWGEKAEIIKGLRDAGITVCAHIGYNPQIHDKPRVFGKDEEQATEIIDGAVALSNAGAALIVLEMVPKELAGKISKTLTIPTIGIGSGNLCDGQVLVVNDLLGLSPKVFKHARKFADLKETMYEAFKDYADAVRSREFPSEENSWRV